MLGLHIQLTYQNAPGLLIVQPILQVSCAILKCSDWAQDANKLENLVQAPLSSYEKKHNFVIIIILESLASKYLTTKLAADYIKNIKNRYINVQLLNK